MKKETELSDVEIEASLRLAEVLRGVHNRLLAEGVISIGPNGKVIFPEKVEIIKKRKNTPRK